MEQNRLSKARSQNGLRYLTLVLHLLSGTADNINLRRGQAYGGVDGDVLGGAIPSKDLHVSLRGRTQVSC